MRECIPDDGLLEPDSSVPFVLLLTFPLHLLEPHPMDSLALPRQGQSLLVEPSSRPPHWGHLTKRKNRTPRAIRMAACGSQGPFPPALSCSVQLEYTLA